MKDITWINPTELLTKEHRTKLGKLHKHVSKICAALIQLGHYNFRVVFPESILSGDQMAKIEHLPIDSPYNNICVYDDGCVQYCDILGNVKFEGTTKSSIKVIIMDILHQ